MSAETAEDIKALSSELRLNADTSATEHVNKFCECFNLLAELNESYVEANTIKMFFKQNINPNYDTVIPISGPESGRSCDEALSSDDGCMAMLLSCGCTSSLGLYNKRWSLI